MDSDEDLDSQISDDDVEGVENFCELVVDPAVNRMFKIDFVQSPCMGKNSVVELLNDYNRLIKYLINYVYHRDSSKCQMNVPLVIIYAHLEQTFSLLNSWAETYIERQAEYQSKIETQCMKMFESADAKLQSNQLNSQAQDHDNETHSNGNSILVIWILVQAIL